MLIAQLSDLHVRPAGRPLSGRVETLPMLGRAVDAVLALRPAPELVAITGDLTDSGLAEEYALLRGELERLPMPVLVVPGNHDHRERLRQGLPPAMLPGADAGFVQFARDAGPLRLIFLDTLEQGAQAGALCARRLAWLAHELARTGDERPILLFMHHPPIRCGLDFMDEIRLLEGAEAFSRLVAATPRIERILCGHVHRPMQRRWHGTLVQMAPSTAHQVTLELVADEAASFVLEPPAMLLHAWSEATGLVTHHAYIDAYPGPFPFVHDPAYPPTADGAPA